MCVLVLVLEQFLISIGIGKRVQKVDLKTFFFFRAASCLLSVFLRLTHQAYLF